MVTVGMALLLFKTGDVSLEGLSEGDLTNITKRRACEEKKMPQGK